MSGILQGSSPCLGFCRYLIMQTLQPFIPDNCTSPVAYMSSDTPDWIKDVINENWDQVSSGLASHYTFEELIGIQEQELFEEYQEEYATANAWWCEMQPIESAPFLYSFF